LVPALREAFTKGPLPEGKSILDISKECTCACDYQDKGGSFVSIGPISYSGSDRSLIGQIFRRIFFEDFICA